MPVEEAIRELGGDPDDYRLEKIESEGTTIGGIHLFSYLGTLHKIVLTPGSKHATARG
jgi:hypothetical protein